MTDVRALARHLQRCSQEGLAPRLEAADLKLWYLAVEELLRRSALADAAYAARRIASAFPDSLIVRRLATLLECAPPAVDDGDFSCFVDQREAQVQVVRRTGAITVLFAFRGRHGSLGLPLAVAHRWFGGLGVHVVYLRDPLGQTYVAGLPALGGDRAAAVLALQAIARGLGASRVLCYGNSSGGYAALLYGLEIGAAAVLAMNAVMIFPADRIEAAFGARAPRRGPPDVADLYRAAMAPPRARLLHGAENANDAASAATMAGVLGATIEAVPDCEGHDVQAALIERGRFGRLLRAFAAGWPEPHEQAFGP